MTYRFRSFETFVPDVSKQLEERGSDDIDFLFLTGSYQSHDSTNSGEYKASLTLPVTVPPFRRSEKRNPPS